MYDFGRHSGVLLASALLAAIVAAIAWRRRARPAGWLLFWLEAAIALWAGASVFEAAACTVPLKLLWSQVSYLGTTLVPALFVLLAVAICYPHAGLRPRCFARVFALPVVTLLLAFTNPWHGWIWPQIQLQENSNLALYSHGVWWWVLVVYSYACLAAAIAILSGALFRLPPSSRSQVATLLLSALFPLAGSIVYIFGHNPVPGFDWTLVGFIASGVLVGWALLRLGLLEILPIARDLVIDQIGEGVLVVDRHGGVLDTNRHLREFLGWPDELPPGAPVEKPLARLGFSLRDVLRRPAPIQDFECQAGDRHFHVHVSPLTGDGVTIGYVLLLHETTELVRLRREKEQLRSAVSTAQSRIHDLSLLLPICAKCKRIRNDQGYWQSVESYMRSKADVAFTHGSCPECMRADLGEQASLHLAPEFGLDRIVD